MKVHLNKLDQPTATLRAVVFNDNALTDGAWDVPGEDGVGGFHILVADSLGEVTKPQGRDAPHDGVEAG